MPYKMRFAGVLIFTFMALTIPAKAGDTQWLLKQCSATQNSISMSYCYGRVEGVSEMMSQNGASMKRNYNPDKRLTICVGDAYPTNGALVQVFINWANKHPEQWQTVDLLGVASAFNETWPCP